MAAYYTGVSNPVSLLEAEAVGIAADSSFALVTIQDSASLAALSLDAVALGQEQGLAAEAIDDLALKTVDRVPVGVDGARLEVLESAQGGRWLFVSISNGGGDRGTFARLEVLAD